MAKALGRREISKMVVENSKESWYDEKHREKQETVISRLLFGHTGLKSTVFKMGKHNLGMK